MEYTAMRDRVATMEVLEGRRLMSSATFYTSGAAKGALVVHGNDFTPNVITIQPYNFGTQFKVVHNGKTQIFARAGVTSIYLFGGTADDVITVLDPKRTFTFPVHIFGRDGNDTLTGGSGRDSIGGGDGDDLIQGGYGNDLLDGGAGNDRVYGGFQLAVTNDGSDTLFGGEGDDLMVGGSGYDRLFGEAGNDVMYGGTPNDPTNKLGDASDDMFGGDGADKMYAGDGRNRMHGMGGDDTLVGGPDNDTLYGGAGDNVSTGGGGRDIGATNAEYTYLYRLLRKFTPARPFDPKTAMT